MALFHGLQLALLLLCLGLTQASASIPLFLTFDSGVAPASINKSATPFLPQLSYVWGASPDPARLAAYKAAAPKVLLSYYMPYSRAPAASEGFTLAFFEARHPEWVLYRCDRKTVAFWDGQTAPKGEDDPGAARGAARG